MKGLSTLFISVFLALLNACASIPQEKLNVLSQTQLEHAKVFENEKKGYQALYKYKVALSLGNNTSDLKQKISELEALLIKQADTHYAKGVKQYGEKQKSAARRQLITALKTYPLHQKSLKFLKRHYPQIYITYQIKKGDTKQSIAKKIYGSSDMSFLIDHFNPNLSFQLGEKIWIPKVNPDKLAPHGIAASTKTHSEDNKEKGSQEEKKYELIARTDDTLKHPDLLKAKKFLTDKRYEQALPLINHVLEQDPENFEASELNNWALFEMGLVRFQQENYTEALNLLERVDPHYDGLLQTKADINRKLQLMEKKDYKAKNNLLYKKGKTLVAEMKYIQAREVFRRVDSDYKNIRQERQSLKAKMLELANQYYKAGVHHFINEKLEQAIAQWKIALEYNAQHTEAQKNMERAHSLLKKLKAIH